MMTFTTLAALIALAIVVADYCNEGKLFV